MKVCTVCKVAKPLSLFSPDRRLSSGVQSRCKSCYAIIMRDRRAADPTQHRETVKRSTLKHYQAKLTRNQEYRKNNPDKVATWKKTDRTRNKARVLADNASRRSLTRSEMSADVVAVYCLRDFYRGMSLGEEFHVDHIVPLSRGGKHCADNLQVIPAIDNLRKGEEMKENFDSALAAVLHHEGGFVNHPADPGGMTNLGVTQRVWQEWVKRPVDEAEMRSLTPEMVAPLYKQRYWDRVRGDDLPAGVDYAVFDCGINSGPGRAVKFLQQVVGADDDGVIGPGTLKAVAAMPADEIVSKYQAKRLEFLQALPTWDTFGKGWGRRVTEVASAAGKMVDGSGSNLA